MAARETCKKECPAQSFLYSPVWIPTLVLKRSASVIPFQGGPELEKAQEVHYTNPARTFARAESSCRVHQVDEEGSDGNMKDA